MPVNAKNEIHRFIRFCIVGLMNTAVTFSVFTLLRYLGASLMISNIVSYVAGIINSFFWNRNWVYRSIGRKAIVEAMLFILFFGICWSTQWIVFNALVTIYPEWLVQLVSMGVYSVTNFVLNRIFTFKPMR